MNSSEIPLQRFSERFPRFFSQKNQNIVSNLSTRISFEIPWILKIFLLGFYNFLPWLFQTIFQELFLFFSPKILPEITPWIEYVLKNPQGFIQKFIDLFFLESAPDFFQKFLLNVFLKFRQIFLQKIPLKITLKISIENLP